MYSGNQLVELLGKSVLDLEVINLLSNIGHAKPVKKPKRGEKNSHVERYEKGIGLVFQLAENLPDAYGGHFPEGELVLHTIFLRPTKDPSAAIYSDLPYGLRYSMSRVDGKSMMGEPKWVVSYQAADLWLIDNRKLRILFLDDESAIDDVTIALPDE